MSHPETAAKFDDWARTGRDTGMEEGHGDVVSQVLNQLTFKPGAVILDLGCGNGWATRTLAKSAPGVQAIGIDGAPEMIARAEELHSYTIRARYEHSSFEKLDFPDEHFDAAFSCEALYYAADLDGALKELHRVLKPSAAAEVVINFYAEAPDTQVWAEAMAIPMHFLGEEAWAERFRGAGFVSAATERVIDSRGPGDPGAFEPSRYCPSWEAHLRSHEAGSLWIRAVR